MTTTVYNLNSIKQLIDLNGDRINFELQFKIDSTDGEPFDVLIVTQEMLDSGQELIYQKAEGSIGGNIVADQGLYQNYLLLLKSDVPIEVTVYTQIKDLPMSQPQQQVQSQQQVQQQVQQQRPQQHSPINKKKNKINWSNIILIVIGIILLVIVCWMFYKYFTKDENKKQEILDTDKLTHDISQSLVSTIDEKLNNSTNSITKTLTKTVDNINEKIDGKLNNLHKDMNNKLSSNLNELNENISKLPGQFSGNLNELNENISKLPGQLSGNLSELNENISKLPGQLSGNFEKLHEQFQGDIEKNNGLISEAIGNTLNKSQLSKTTDLDTIKSQLNDISVKLNNEDGQIKNPLSKSLNKENLKNTIKNLKISS